MDIYSSTRSIKGVGKKTEETLKKIDIYTMRDLLYYLPRTYRDLSTVKKISDVSLEEVALFKVRIQTAPYTRRIRKGLEITSFQVSDGSGVVEVTLFNQFYIKNHIRKGDTVHLYGKLSRKYNKTLFSSPEFYFEPPKHPYLPIYPLTAGLTQNMMRKFITQALTQASLNELYTAAFRQQIDLPKLRSALRGVHFPKSEEHLKRSRDRIVFDELLVFSRMLELLNEDKLENSRIVFSVQPKDIDCFIEGLSFAPTQAQLRVMNEIAADFGKKSYMNRMIQGDVGSGKTLLAFFAMNCMLQRGYQSIMLAPTEILAKQHYQSALEFFEKDCIQLVDGSMTAAERQLAEERMADGSAKIIIGTHALIYGNIVYKNPGLLITDEQHRFGVKQRAAISGKHDLHTLIMSATPIPRSLALVLYGRTDMSVVDEMPPGRKDVKTYIIRDHKYEEMIDFIRWELKAGRQAYMVCPVIEEDESDELVSVEELFKEIQLQYKGYQVALLHGRLKNDEKEQIMKEYAAGDIRVLVSTTVIEVGINVPNATVMTVLNAERFGLAQLHQLRGRVGRGEAQSYCFLVSDHAGARERLQVMTQTNDGFIIAEKDMEFRGVGDVFGTRQHGKGPLIVANLIQDMDMLEKSKEMLLIIERHPDYQDIYKNITKTASELTNKNMVEIALN